MPRGGDGAAVGPGDERGSNHLFGAGLVEMLVREMSLELQTIRGEALSQARSTIRVQWPDGEWSHPYRVFANQHVRIIRGEANARYWYPVAQ